jgi:hypothetical protein
VTPRGSRRSDDQKSLPSSVILPLPGRAEFGNPGIWEKDSFAYVLAGQSSPVQVRAQLFGATRSAHKYRRSDHDERSLLSHGNAIGCLRRQSSENELSAIGRQAGAPVSGMVPLRDEAAVCPR